MALSRALALVVVIGCGGARTAAPVPDKPVAPPVASPAVASVPAAEPPPEPVPPRTPAVLDPKTLPEWPIPAIDREPSELTVEIYAADVDGDWLLTLVLPRINYLQRTTNKKLTGRLTAPGRHHATAALAAQLGVDASHVQVAGKSRDTVEFDFRAAPIPDLMNVLADVGRFNVVIGAVPLSPVTVILKGAPTDGAFKLIAERAGLVTLPAGNTRYVLAKGATLPRLRTLAGGRLDVRAHNATVAQIVAAVRGVTKLSLGSCSSTKIPLVKLRNAPLAEVVRAIEVASGETLTEGAECSAQPYANEPVSHEEGWAIATAGKKRAGAITRDGTLLVGAVEPPVWTPPLKAERTSAWLDSFKRTAALVRIGVSWQAIVETAAGLRVIRGDRHDGAPEGVRFEVNEAGVHIKHEGELEHDDRDDQILRVLPLSAEPASGTSKMP